MADDNLVKVYRRFLLLWDQIADMDKTQPGTAEQWHCIGNLMGAIRIDLGLDEVVKQNKG